MPNSAPAPIDFVELIAGKVVEKLKPEILAAMRDLSPQNKKSNSGPLLFSYKQAGAQLGVSGMTVARFAKKGMLRTVTLGARKLIPAAELSKLVNQLIEESGQKKRRSP